MKTTPFDSRSILCYVYDLINELRIMDRYSHDQLLLNTDNICDDKEYSVALLLPQSEPFKRFTLQVFG